MTKQVTEQVTKQVTEQMTKKMFKLSDDSIGSLMAMGDDFKINTAISTFYQVWSCGRKSENDPIMEEAVFQKIKHLTLTVKDYDKLVTTYKESAIEDVLLAMQNFAGLKKYTSAFLTANNWLKRRGKEALISTKDAEYGSKEWMARQ